MRDSFIGAIVVGLSAVVVCLLLSIHLDSGTLHRIIVVLLFILILSLYTISLSNIRERFLPHGKWFLLSITTFITQLVVMTTGGVKSQYFILFHLALFGISILYTLPIGIFFFISTVIIIYVDTLLNKTLLQYFAQDPGATMLYLVSYLSVIPFVQTIAKRYHLKDEINTLLSKQIEAEEAIIDSVSELIIVTDSHMKILSVNDAVEQTLQKSRAELIDKNLFDCLYLKDTTGTLFNAETIPLSQIIHDQTAFKKNNLWMLSTSSQSGTVHIQVHASLNGENGEAQLMFIIVPDTVGQIKLTVDQTQTEFNVKRDARFEELQKSLHSLGHPDIELQFLLLMKLQRDSEQVALIDAHAVSYTPVKFDLARLVQNVVASSQNFVTAFHSEISFSFVNFGEKDIAPLITKVLSVKPDQLTGPFFTITSDVKQMNIVLQTLIDMGVLLSSTERDPNISVTISREGLHHIVVTMQVASPNLIPDELPLLWKRKYGNLMLKTNLQRGSGYEGLIASALAETLHVPLHVTYNQDSSLLIIRLLVEK